MSREPHSFKRLVLGLQPGAHDRSMRVAVELADLLHLDLLGLFLEDTSLRDLASIPFSREFRPLGGGWHTIDIERLSRDVELAARGLERKFLDAAKRLLTGYQFEVARGPMAKTFASVSRSDDIVMIVEPQSPAERATLQFAWLLEAAFKSAAAVMLVPPTSVEGRVLLSQLQRRPTTQAFKRLPLSRWPPRKSWLSSKPTATMLTTREYVSWPPIPALPSNMLLRRGWGWSIRQPARWPSARFRSG